MTSDIIDNKTPFNLQITRIAIIINILMIDTV